MQAHFILDRVKAFLLTAFVTTAFAASPAIGIVTASGHFTLERSRVWGNSTLFDGATVETDAASSDLALRNGVRIQLGSASRARVWENRVLIEKGVGQVTAPQFYEVDAAGFKIRGARLRVGLADSVEVTTLAGLTRVESRSGVLLASIAPGRTISFSMQAAGGDATRTGCLLYKDGRFILQDENTQEVVEIIGPGLAPNVGNRVEITGTASNARPAVSIATRVVNMTAVSPRSQGGCLSVAASLEAKAEVDTTPGTPAAQTAPKEPKTGMSTGAKVAIGAVIVGGGVGGALAALGRKKSTSP
jgi:hypothetical protein